MSVRILLTSGTTADCTQNRALSRAEHLLADRGYDSGTIVEHAKKQGMRVVIAPRKNRKAPREYDDALYRHRHLIESAFLQALVRHRHPLCKICETRLDELMVKIRSLHPKTGARCRKGLEKQQWKRKRRSSASAQTAGLGERAQNFN